MAPTADRRGRGLRFTCQPSKTNESHVDGNMAYASGIAAAEQGMLCSAVAGSCGSWTVTVIANLRWEDGSATRNERVKVVPGFSYLCTSRFFF